MRVVLKTWAVAALGAALALGSRPAVLGQEPGRVHPTLPKADSAVCATCHEDLLRGKKSVHAPVASDCATCHVVTADEAGTRVALSEAQPALCRNCHDDVLPAASGTWKSPHPPAVESCLICHDPHASDRERLLSAPVQSVCGTCHEIPDLAKPHGGQILGATDCAACHAPHGSGNPGMLRAAVQHRPFADGSCVGCHQEPYGDRIRLRVRGDRLCTSCHGEFGLPAAGGSLHAALRGERSRAGCLSCHDPHMSDHAKLMKQAGSAACAACHGEIVGAAARKGGHPPAAEDCTVCHEPHVSPQAHLLKSAVPGLCADCHDASDAALRKAHLDADLETAACTTCHDAHGAGNENLLARHVHPPLLEGCETCHEGSADKVAEGGSSALCLNCHGDVGDAAKNAPAPHAAMEAAPCVACHEPHASSQPRLIRQPGGGICVACHDDQAAGAGEVAHGVTETIGCQACHEPHGGDKPKLLRESGDPLCLTCHDPGRLNVPDEGSSVEIFGRFPVSAAQARAMATLRLGADGQHGHPTPEHRALGTPTPAEMKRTETKFTGALACQTCHSPHKGKSARLFQWGAASSTEACIQCHPK